MYCHIQLKRHVLSSGIYRRKKPDINIQAGTFYNGVPDFSIKITKKDPETNRLEDLIIYDHRDGRGNTSVILADSGYMKLTPDETGLIMTIYSGRSYTEMAEKKQGSSFRRVIPQEKIILKNNRLLFLLPDLILNAVKRDCLNRMLQ